MTAVVKPGRRSDRRDHIIDKDTGSKLTVNVTQHADLSYDTAIATPALWTRLTHLSRAQTFRSVL